MHNRRFQVAIVTRQLTLLVYRGGNSVLDILLCPGIVGRCKRTQAVIGLFRLGEIVQIELRVCNYRPCGTRERRLYRRLSVNNKLADADGKIKLVLRKQIFGHRCQDGACFRMFRVGIRKLEPAVEVLLMPNNLFFTL